MLIGWAAVRISGSEAHGNTAVLGWENGRRSGGERMWAGTKYWAKGDSLHLQLNSLHLWDARHEKILIFRIRGALCFILMWILCPNKTLFCLLFAPVQTSRKTEKKCKCDAEFEPDFSWALKIWGDWSSSGMLKIRSSNLCFFRRREKKNQ